MAKTTLNTLAEMKKAGDKIACLTAYDSTFSQVLNAQKIDVILVGDSLGMVCQGDSSTVSVTIDDMCYHTRNTKKGAGDALLMSDLPFGSYTTEEQALTNATRLMQAGAEVIKIEGEAWLANTVTRLRQQGIPACVHMGLTPQSVHVFGGYKVQGRQLERANAMIQSAITLEAAGAALILLECIPVTLAREITQAVSIPVIGIGAGVDIDGQILVLYDMLGLTSGHTPRFVKNFMAGASSPQEAISDYIKEVKNSLFPAQMHSYE